MVHYPGSRYAAYFDKFGCSIVRVSDGEEVCFLQGDDSDNLLATLQEVEELTFTRGPFRTIYEMIDSVLGDYDY